MQDDALKGWSQESHHSSPAGEPGTGKSAGPEGSAYGGCFLISVSLVPNDRSTAQSAVQFTVHLNTFVV